jgi:uroporphyrinogen-III synthase/uroporphyrinogen III methyltransferase/synthase
VLVTRALHQAGKLSDGLRALGAEPVEVPVLEIRAAESFDALDAAIQNLTNYDWLILTSANAVRALVERAYALGIELAQPAGLKVAAVGGATADAARDAGWNVVFTPENYVAESLVQGLVDGIAGQRVLLVRAAAARDVIPEALRAAGAEVSVVNAYRNVMPEAAPELLRRAISGGIDAAAFTSSSSVTHLAEAAAIAGIAWPLPRVAAVSIGPITSRTLRGLGWEPAVEAKCSDVPGLIAAVVQYFGR